MIPKIRFFGRVADGQMRMVLAEAIDFTIGFVYYSYHDYTVEGDDNVYGDTISFENCVLMQSTGLFDKNGKEIFEGDVVKVTDGDERTDFSDGGNGTICGLDDLYMWYIDGQVQNGLFDINQEYYIEVIGNIYQNPELLEVE